MKKDKYKRLELYLGWKCNQKCFFCVEMPIMLKHWNHIISNEEIGAKLIYYKKLGYNHITFLGGEPTIQKNYLFAIKFARKLGYKVLITTNGLMYQFENFAKKTLSYIDELIISIPCIEEELQKEINGTKISINFDKVFTNIKKYFSGNLLKINTVIHKKNINNIEGISNFIKKYNIKNFSLTYPELQANFYGYEYLLENTLIKYKDINFKKIVDLFKNYDIILRIADIPICIIGEKFIHLTDDINYSLRLKVDENLFENDRINILPRSRINTKICDGCNYTNVCWGIHKSYLDIYGDSELKRII